MIIKEIQLDNDNTVEISFSMDSPQGKNIFTRLMMAFPYFDFSKYQPEMLSIHGKDTVDYPNQSICMTCVGLPPTELVERDDLIDYFVIKFELETGNVFYKFHRQCETNPTPFRLASEFGTGFTLFDDTEYVYFYHNDVEEVYRYYGFDEPTISSKFHEVENALFGITIKNGKALKLKRYLYPRDLNLKFPNNIYGC